MILGYKISLTFFFFFFPPNPTLCGPTFDKSDTVCSDFGQPLPLFYIIALHWLSKPALYVLLACMLNSTNQLPPTLPPWTIIYIILVKTTNMENILCIVFFSFFPPFPFIFFHSQTFFAFTPSCVMLL